MNRGHLFVLMTALISGVSIFLNAFAVAKFDPFVFTTLKNTLVVLLIGLVLYGTARHRDFLRLRLSEWAKLVAIGVTGGSVPFLLFFWGLSQSIGAAGSFLHKTMFIWVSLLAFVFLKEKLSRKQVLAGALLFLGTVLFLGITPGALSIGLPEIAILGATIFWSIETVISRNALQSVKPGLVMFSRMFFGAIVLYAFLAATGKATVVAAMTGTQWLWIAFTAALLFGYVYTWYNGLALVKAGEATAILLLGSVVTSALSVAFLGKELQLTALVGMLLMVAGVWWMSGSFSKIMGVLNRVHGVPCKSPEEK